METVLCTDAPLSTSKTQSSASLEADVLEALKRREAKRQAKAAERERIGRLLAKSAGSRRAATRPSASSPKKEPSYSGARGGRRAEAGQLAEEAVAEAPPRVKPFLLLTPP